METQAGDPGAFARFDLNRVAVALFRGRRGGGAAQPGRS